MTTMRRPASIFAIPMAIAAVTAVLSPSPAQSAPCTSYSFPGRMAINQSNGFRIEFNGTGDHIGAEVRSYGNDQRLKSNGWLEGEVNGDRVNFKITWGSGESVGIYSGAVLDNGRAAGTTYDEMNPAGKASWNSVQSFTCIA
jgi:hypothetical protein